MHIYKDVDGKEYVSVTTIIHKVLIDPEPLLKWSNIMGFRHKKYEDLMDYSANYGTLMHLAMEKYMKEEKIPEDIDPLIYRRITSTLDQFDSFCDKVHLLPSDTFETEKTIISAKLGYAGTIDWVGKYKDGTAIIDYKTSKIARLPYFIQVAAYDKWLQEEMDIKVDRAVILTLREDRVKDYEISREELDKYYDIFVAMKTLYEKLSELE